VSVAVCLTAGCSSLEQLSPASRQVRDSYQGSVERGNDALAAHRYADAGDAFQEALALRRDDPAALQGLARSNLGTGKGEAALAALARLERSDPLWYRSHAGPELRRALALSAERRLRMGDPAGCLELLERLESQQSDHPAVGELRVEALVVESGRLQVAQRTEEAAARFRESGGGAVEGSDLAYGLAVALMDHGYLGLAIAVLSDGIELSPEDERLEPLMDRALRIRYPNGLPD